MAKRITPDAVIDLTLDSDTDDEQHARLSDVRKNLYGSDQKKKKVKTEPSASSNGIVDTLDAPATTPSTQFDDVEIVDVPAAKIAAEESLTNDTDGDVVMVGTINETILPHMRPHCTKFKFQPNPNNRSNVRVSNALHCDLCYCYVCDKPVKECESWQAGGSNMWNKNHCNATDSQRNWVNQRHQATAKKSAPAASGGTNSRFSNSRFSFLDEIVDRNEESRSFLEELALHQFLGTGPYEPTNTQAATSQDFTTCGTCGWHSRTSTISGGVGWGQLNAKEGRCLKCGLIIAPSKSREESIVYNNTENAIFLGSKVIPFRIIAKDVRSMDQYEEAWSESSWVFDEAKEEESYFKNMIGTRPLIKWIKKLVPNSSEEVVREKNDGGIILENPKDYTLFHILGENQFGRSLQYASSILGDSKASWQRETRSGTFTIRVFVKDKYHRDVTRLLGCWFDIFPFKLSDLSDTIKAKFIAKGSRRLTPSAETERKIKRDIKEHNKIADAKKSQFSLTASSGDSNIGGVTNNETDLKGVLQRFYREGFVTTQFSEPRISSQSDLDRILSDLYASSADYSGGDHDYILSFKDRAFAAHFLARSAAKVARKLTRVGGVMEHLENLGHESELTCEGLSVELLAFQKQSLRWALERETTPGGVQSYFWPKVSLTSTDQKSELYFCPIIGRFRTDKPKVVRGGIIAEEMGLGKTVISLGLILKHPAPAEPVSGSHVSCLSNLQQTTGDGASEWDTDLYAQTSSTNAKRGSILAQGTLVVCPVSLVGQWIEEAKNKLDDPGLVYSYHGGSRTRDPRILAKNAIVVTTYQVLASDDTYWRAKSTEANYCPPLEQVRWWRIICDEGHMLRTGNTGKNKSVSALVADHKWIVTGTPVNTSVKDLRNQLKFIGIERVDEIFRACCEGEYSYGRNRNRSGDNIAAPSKLLFFLRSLIMRHTQRQCYAGTQTTLMSLPAKTERQIEVSLSGAERREYDRLDKEAKNFYIDFKRTHLRDLSKYYLKLSQKLTPMRVACSGGHFPLEAVGATDNEDEDGTMQKKKSDKIYSDFCFTSKFHVLVTELKRVRDEDPSSKSLVFSQYTSTLEWLQKELPKHGFQFRTLSGDMSMKKRAKALHDFQSDPPTTIFLLSMRAGNCGINLTQANRVFLMEPGFNPALEQQAIGRVHRLGQKREVEIVRLVVKDSIETRLREFLKKKYGDTSSSSSADAVEDKSDSPPGDPQEDPEEDSKPAAKPSGKRPAIGPAAIGPVGNIATERPKSAILGEEFDMLFGVKTESTTEQDVAMPDAATSAGFI